MKNNFPVEFDLSLADELTLKIFEINETFLTQF